MKTAVVLNALRVSLDFEESLWRRFADSDIALHRTRFAGHATGLARAAANAGADTVIAVGGDGTVGEVVNGIAGTPAVLGVIPTGTANDFAAALGLPHRLSDACSVIETGCLAQVDLLSANGRYFVSAGGLGLACEALARAGARSQALLRQYGGSATYLVGLMRAFARRGSHAEHIRIQADGRVLERRVSMLLWCNQPRIGRHFTVSPDARLASGLVHLCCFETMESVFRLGVSIWKARHGTHVACPHVEEWASARVEIERERPLPFFVDGELQPPCRTISLCVHPGALTVVAPPAARAGDPGTPVKLHLPEGQAKPGAIPRAPPGTGASRIWRRVRQGAEKCGGPPGSHYLSGSWRPGKGSQGAGPRPARAIRRH